MKALEAQRKAEKENQIKIAENISQKNRKEFQNKYEHVWIDGKTDIRIVQMTVPDNLSIDKLMDNALFENLFSDCEVVHHGLSKTFLNDGKEVILDGEYELYCATATDRLDEIKKQVPQILGCDNIDMIATTPITGNINYFKYVNE